MVTRQLVMPLSRATSPETTLDRVRALMRVDCEVLETRTGHSKPAAGLPRARQDRHGIGRHEPKAARGLCGRRRLGKHPRSSLRRRVVALPAQIQHHLAWHAGIQSVAHNRVVAHARRRHAPGETEQHSRHPCAAMLGRSIGDLHCPLLTLHSPPSCCTAADKKRRVRKGCRRDWLSGDRSGPRERAQLGANWHRAKSQHAAAICVQDQPEKRRPRIKEPPKEGRNSRVATMAPVAPGVCGVTHTGSVRSAVPGLDLDAAQAAGSPSAAPISRDRLDAAD